MSAASASRDAVIDLDDPDGLLTADREGLLRAASMAGAQMRAAAAALDEGELDAARSSHPPRTVSWVATRGTAEVAGGLLGAALAGSMAAPFVVAGEVPPWIGPLDVLVVAGGDPGDPTLIAAAATGIRRGARVVVVAPDDGPLREVAADRAVVLGPRLRIPQDFGLARYLAAGLATLRVVDPGMQVDLSALADDLDAEALRDSAGRDLFTNPAKTLAQRMTGREVVLAGDRPATLALARHGGAMMLRVGHRAVATAALSDALAAIQGGMNSGAVDYETALFHDEELDGPLAARTLTLVLTADDERHALLSRVSGFDDVDVISAEDVPDASSPRPGGRPEQQVALLALRLEMTAAYLRLMRG